MKYSILASIGIAVAVHAAPVHAEHVQEKHIASGKFKLDPTSGYIFLVGPSLQSGVFLKIPDQSDIDAYNKEWEETFEKEKVKYAARLRSWEKSKATAQQLKERLPTKPIEPTRENFSLEGSERRNSIRFGPGSMFRKEKERLYYSYMLKLSPGTYVYHGPVWFDVNYSPVGVCYCMGSVQFKVKPGVVTDLGNFLLNAHELGQIEATPMQRKVAAGIMSNVAVNKDDPKREVQFGMPESLKAFPTERADFRAAGKAPNHFGVLVTRMPPIAGVLAYQRDKVVDLKAQSSAP